MQDLLINIMSKYGYIGVFFLILVENIFPPIPSEVILLFSGFFSTYTNLSVLYMIVASTLGSFLGAIILYYIGKIFNKERLKKIVNGRLGKILFLKENDIDKADEWFDNKGNKSVFFCRFVPIVRSLISIPAGMSEMPMGKFIIYTICGSMIWNTVLICLGFRLGSNWEYVLTILDKYQMVVIVILVIIFGYVIIKFYRKKRKSKKI